jgi:hypothetical protein
MWWVYELPIGKGKPLLNSAKGVTNAIFGGWQFSGIWTQSTAIPWSVGNGRFWATNWNLTGFGTPVGAITPSNNTKNAAGIGGPNVWPNPRETLSEWQFTLPGQSGSRNTVRTDGLSNFDIGLAKRFIMPWSERHSLQFRWETFNMFNQVQFTSPDLTRVNTPTWGQYTEQMNSPRQMQFGLRYDF